MSFPSNPTALSLPPLASAAFHVANAILNWEIRRTTRRRLAMLDDHLLKDVGLTKADARAEAETPFWR